MDEGEAGKGWTRRKFLRRVGAGAVGLGVATLRGSEIVKPPEREVPVIAVIDIFNLQLDLEGNQITKDMGKEVQKMWGGHGSRVVETLKNTAGKEKQIIVEQSMVPAVGVKMEGYDNLGNPVMEMKISEEKMEEIVKNSGGDIVNLSWELGTSEITYEAYTMKKKYPDMGRMRPQERNGQYQDYLGKPISKQEYEKLLAKADEEEKVLLPENDRTLRFVDGYAGGKTEENLRGMVKLARKFPEKTFVVAGGNPTITKEGTKYPDIRKAKAKMKNERVWPDNLLIVGVEYFRQGTRFLGGYGADIYVNEKDLEAVGAQKTSSFATPVIAETVRQKGVEGLGRVSEKKEVWVGEEKIEYRVLR